MEQIDTLEIKIAKARMKLSAESRQAIDAVNWKMILLGMTDKFNSEQLEVLKTETELLLCGITNNFDFPKELEARMKLPKKEVALLLTEMDKLIFQKMKASLKETPDRVPEKETLYAKKFFMPDPKFAGLQKELQEAIYYSNWRDKLYLISKKYNLAIDKKGELEDIIVKTISGVIHSDQLEKEVIENMNLSFEKSREMVSEINEAIFKNIKEVMVGGGTIKNLSDDKTGEELIIRNEQEGISKNSIKKGVPLPPYKSNKNEVLEIKNVNIPLPPYKSIKNEELGIKNEEGLKLKNDNVVENNSNFSNSETDMYREHGIEIISENNYMAPVEEQEKISISYVPVKPSEPVSQNNSVRPSNESNIVVNKLFGNTASQKVMTDYSLPKVNTLNQSLSRIQGEAPAKPHDPYHEQI